MERTLPSLPQLLGAARARLRAAFDGLPVWLVAAALWFTGRAVRQQLRTLHLPILGEHRWREAATYSVAYNFAHGAFDFLRPRVDFNLGKSGIMGMEAPVVPFLIALAMRVFGDAPAVGRAVVYSLSCLGLAAVLAMAHRIRGASLSLAFLFAFLLSPMTLVELRQIQPDGATGMLAGASAFYLYRFSDLERRRDYALGLAAYTLTVFAKGPAIVLCPAMWWFASAARPVPLRTLVLRAVPFVVPFLVYEAWDAWEHHLSDVYNQGWTHFSVDFTWPDVWKNLKFEGPRKNIFWFLYPCYVGNWALFPALVVGFPAALQPRFQRVSFGFLAWLGLGSFFLASFSDRLKSNWYYADIVLVPVTYFTAHGLAEVLRVFKAGPLPRQPLVGRWAALFVLATLASGSFIVLGIDKRQDVVGSSGPRPDNSWMSEWHLTMLLVGLGLALLVATHASKRGLKLAAYALLPFCAYGLARGQRDAVESLIWRSREQDEREYKRLWIDGLRPIVDRYSTRDDLFVVDETDVDDPYWLHLPLRKGWAINPDDVNVANVSYCQRQGARFFLTYHDHPPPEELRPARLAGNDAFQLYCLDPRGCPPRR